MFIGWKKSTTHTHTHTHIYIKINKKIDQKGQFYLKECLHAHMCMTFEPSNESKAKFKFIYFKTKILSQVVCLKLN